MRKPGEKLSTRLIAVIDDASRLVPYAEYRATEQEEDLWIVLMEAMERRGLPRKLYTDYVPRHIIGVMCPTALCGRSPPSSWSAGTVDKFKGT